MSVENVDKDKSKPETVPLFSETDAQGNTHPVAPPLPTPPTDTASGQSDYTYVRLPDGSVDKVRTSDIVHASSRNDTGAPVVTDEPEEFYVHLADGSVERVKSNEVPLYGGSNANFGHFERDGNVFLVTGVYPVETKAGK